MSAVKTSVFIATSLDGYIARADGDIDWLSAFDGGDEDYGYQAFVKTIDAIVMGRRSFEKVLSFAPWPYGDKRIVVLSHGAVSIPLQLVPSVDAMAGAPREIVARLAGRGARHLYVDGGATIQGFLSAGLIDELVLTRVPLLLGGGIQLFGPLAGEVRLRHIATRAYTSGLVQSRYAIAR